MSYKCEKCNRTFSTKEYLRKHNNRKNACNVVYKCEKCEKKFQNAALLERHNNRKTSCIPESIPIITGDNEENMCHLCGKTYASAYNLKRHQSSCTVKDNPNILINLLKTQQEQNSQLIEIINRNGLGDKVTNITNNTMTLQQNNLYMNVTIIPFGDEDYAKLDSSKVMNLVKNHTSEFVPKMIEYIHANPHIPEYHNVFYDKQNKVAIKFTAISAETKTWVKTDPKEVSDQITGKLKNYMHPLNSPYFNMAMKNRDTETANKVINLSNPGGDTFDKNMEALAILPKNQSFMDQVKVQELE